MFLDVDFVPKAYIFFLNCNFLKEVDSGDASNYAPIVITRLERISWDAIMTNQLKYSQIRVQVLWLLMSLLSSNLVQVHNYMLY